MTLPYIISGAILLVALAIWHVFRVHAEYHAGYSDGYAQRAVRLHKLPRLLNPLTKQVPAVPEVIPR